MKKVLLVMTLVASALVMSSCFGRDCVCKTTIKDDGDKVSKTKTSYYDMSDSEKDDCKDYDETITVGETETETKCR